MKAFLLLPMIGIMALSNGCSTERKYDRKQAEIQKEEAIEMIKESKGVEIDRARLFGKDKIILKRR